MNFETFIEDLDRYKSKPWLMAADACLGVGEALDRNNAYHVVAAIALAAYEDPVRAEERFSRAVAERPALYACIAFYTIHAVSDGLMAWPEANEMMNAFDSLLPDGVPVSIIEFYNAAFPAPAITRESDSHERL